MYNIDGTDLTSGVDSNPVGQEDHYPQKDNHPRILHMHIPTEAKRKAKEQQRLERWRHGTRKRNGRTGRNAHTSTLKR
jgi:truncated hemoglobin YjbI